MNGLDSKREFELLSFIRKRVIRRIRVSKFFFSIFLLLFAFSLVYLVIQIKSVKNSYSTFDSAFISAEFQIANAKKTASDIVVKAEKEAKAREEARKKAEEEARKKAEEEAEIKAKEEARKKEKQKLSSYASTYTSSGDFPITLTYYELDLLYRLVQAEAGDQSKLGKQAVVWVVLNRLFSSEFQSTIEKIIYATDQFSPVYNGDIKNPAEEDTKVAVDEVLAGNVDDPTNSAMYFCELDEIENEETRYWFEHKLTCVAIIGCHNFYVK